METKQHATKKPKGQWVNQEGNFKNLKTDDNEDTTTQNLWNATIAGLRGKFIAIQAFLKKEAKSQINDLTQHLNELEKEEQAKLKSAEGRKS